MCVVFGCNTARHESNPRAVTLSTIAVDVDVALPGTVVRDTSSAYISTRLQDISARITKDVGMLQGAGRLQQTNDHSDGKVGCLLH